MPRRLVALLTAVSLMGCASERKNERAPRLAPVAVSPSAGFEPAGVGSLEVRQASGDASLARLTRVHVAARQVGDMAEVEASHTFHNDSDAVLEGTFRFPLPDGALLTGLGMMIDGKLMEGELVEREKARKTYETIVDGMQDPALLEWEHGSIFKVRVFPLEPRQDKVVVVRYLAPLRREPAGLSFVQAASGASDGELAVDWQGSRIFQGQKVEAHRLVSAAARPVSAVLRERRADASYAVVRLSPDWSRITPAKQPTPRRWFIVVDTSRSALEELPRELEALEAVLHALPAGARFQVITSDLDARPAPQGLQPVTEATIREALGFVRRVTPDGASDLSRALNVVGRLAASAPDSALVYLGDCEPTWGVTDPGELVAQLRRELPSTAFHPLLLGSSVNDDLADELALASGGRRARARRREDVDAFARSLTRPVPSLAGVELHAPAGTEILTQGPLTLEPSRDLLLYVKAPADRDPLQGVSARAKLGSATLDLMPRALPEDARGVAQRFGAALVRQLEKKSQPAPQIVAASLEYGVMSKLTSFLVLESEEAYARFAIERKNAPSADTPRVTGANLESADGADISADRVQPGDPEILIDASRDALRVTVQLPSGETKVATYDPEARGGRGAWLVRFLVALDTPEGEYEASVSIHHPDGHLETRKVRYQVDNTAPTLEVRLTPARRRPGWTEVQVTEAGDRNDSDLKRVEVLTPAGVVYQLTAIRWGVFRALIPDRDLGAGTLRVVGFDQALNHTVKEVSLQ
jgi:Vault protein inter-alpha-trypsin domain/von Willebrand factor type A domain